MSVQAIDALCLKWSRVFKIPSAWIKSLAYVETKWRPRAINTFGTAFGLMQMKVKTASDMFSRMKRFAVFRDQHVQETLHGWTGQGEDLYDPELSILFAAFYLKTLSRIFGNLPDVIIAAYNQGHGAVTRALIKAKEKGCAFVEFLKPAGREFIDRFYRAQT